MRAGVGQGQAQGGGNGDGDNHKHNNYQTLKIPTSNYHVFNSQSWTFPVHTGEIILFPSFLSHEVSQKIGDNLRTSLSFNTYVKGTIGEKMELTELIL